MPTTTELTEKYLEEHPSIKDCLKHGIINYSKLSRKIAQEAELDSGAALSDVITTINSLIAKLNNSEFTED